MKAALAQVSQIYSEFRRNKDGLREMYVRTRKDGWVVGRYFGEREFYVILDQKNYTLVEVYEQVKKLTNIFFCTGAPLAQK